MRRLNNGQANLLFDDQTGACDGSTTALRDEHTVTLKVPHKPSSAYDILVRFEIDWNASPSRPRTCASTVRSAKQARRVVGQQPVQESIN